MSITGARIQVISELCDILPDKLIIATDHQIALGDSGLVLELVFFLQRYCSNHNEYVTGISIAQALFHILELKKERMNIDLILDAYAFFMERLGPGPCSYYHRGLSLLGCLDPDLKEPVDWTNGLAVVAWFMKNFALESPEDMKAYLIAMITYTSERFRLVRHLNYQHERKWANCKMFETEEGYLGIAPKLSIPGDIVYAIHGCSRPMIFRQQGDHYFYIGTCFILGFMRGELSEMLERGDIVLERLDIH